MTKFEKSLEQWFEDSMDRLGAAYKRRVQLVGMSVAILVVVAVNANTITIVRTLSTNSTLRQALVGMATQAVNDSIAHGATAGAPAWRSPMPIATAVTSWWRGCATSA